MGLRDGGVGGGSLFGRGEGRGERGEGGNEGGGRGGRNVRVGRWGFDGSVFHVGRLHLYAVLFDLMPVLFLFPLLSPLLPPPSHLPFSINFFSSIASAP